MEEELQISSFNSNFVDFDLWVLRFRILGALSSGGERLLHTQEVRGSNPLAPTISGK